MELYLGEQAFQIKPHLPEEKPEQGVRETGRSLMSSGLI